MAFLVLILLIAVMLSSEYLDSDITAMTKEFNKQLSRVAKFVLKKIFYRKVVCLNIANVKQAAQFTKYIRLLEESGVQKYTGEVVVWKQLESPFLFTPSALPPLLARYGVELEQHLLPAKMISYGCCGTYEKHGGSIVCVITRSLALNKCNSDSKWFKS